MRQRPSRHVARGGPSKARSVRRNVCRSLLADGVKWCRRVPVLEHNGGGAFINMLSVYSWVSEPLISTYSASKAAAWSFTNAARIELKRQGTHVVGVHVGAVDTDMAAAFEFEKLPPAIVAASALDALEADEPEAVVDDYSRAIKAGLSDDQAALDAQIEREFLAITGAETTAT